jgi:UDP-N-acetyl-2-amino-2-deoxyglucuronate dehydrogenase
MNQAIHNVDLLLWLMGEADSVSGAVATLAHERIEVEDTAAAVVTFRSGALGVIRATTSVHPGYPKTIAIHGDRGTVEIEHDDVMRWDFADETDADRAVKARFATRSGASGGAADPKAISHEGHRRQLADFVAAVRDGRAPAVDGREGRRAVALIAAIYESARTGRRIDLRG